MIKRMILTLLIFVLCFGLISCDKEHTHTFDEGKIIKDATCTMDGIKEYKCTGCEETKQEVINMLGHTIVVDEAVEATCEEEGLTEGNHCSVCKEVLVKQESIAVKTHSYNNLKCIYCGCGEEIVVPEHLLTQGVTEDIYVVLREFHQPFEITKYLGNFNNTYVVWYQELTPSIALTWVEEVAGMVYIGSEYFGLKVINNDKIYSLQEALDNNLLTKVDLEEIFVAYYGYNKDDFVCQENILGKYVLGIQTKYNILLDYYEEILNLDINTLKFEKDAAVGTGLLFKEEDLYFINLADGRKNLETKTFEIAGMTFKMKDNVAVIYYQGKLFSLIDAYNNQIINENQLIKVNEYFK